MEWFYLYSAATQRGKPIDRFINGERKRDRDRERERERETGMEREYT
jgi:hypothetical protein